ncbi:MAG: hypothetical protein KC609_16740 [Myxococcales bacterium]|nr:hypothetical protein [Myxococcales bacterium]
MKLENLSKHIIADAIDTFYKTINKHVSHVVKVLGGETYSVPRTPRKVGFKEYEFFYAADLDTLFHYALGEAKASPSYIRTICSDVEVLLTRNAVGKSVPLDWAEFGQTALGLAIRAARARMKLRDGADDESMSGEEVSLLSSVGVAELDELPLEPKKGKKGAPLEFQVEDVRKAFEKENIAI